jgi:hypothetical protein
MCSLQVGILATTKTKDQKQKERGAVVNVRKEPAANVRQTGSLEQYGEALALFVTPTYAAADSAS